jgi:hypothetical protein
MISLIIKQKKSFGNSINNRQVTGGKQVEKEWKTA